MLYLSNCAAALKPPPCWTRGSYSDACWKMVLLLLLKAQNARRFPNSVFCFVSSFESKTRAEFQIHVFCFVSSSESIATTRYSRMQTRYGIVAKIVPPSLPIWSQNGSKNFKMEPKTVNLPPTWVQKAQDGAKMAKTKLEHRFYRLWGLRDPKNSYFLATKMVGKSIKEAIEKSFVF